MTNVADETKTATETKKPSVVRCAECDVIAINTDEHVGTIRSFEGERLIEERIFCLECLDDRFGDDPPAHSGGRILRATHRLLRLQRETDQQWRWLRATVESMADEKIWPAAHAFVAAQKDLGRPVSYSELRANLYVGDDGSSVVRIDLKPCQGEWKRSAGVPVVVFAHNDEFEFAVLPYSEAATEHDRKLAAERSAAADLGADADGIPF